MSPEKVGCEKCQWTGCRECLYFGPLKDGPVETEYRLGWGKEPCTLKQARDYARASPGWQPIIDYLFKQFEHWCVKVHITQVKEKFGGLRFYYAYIEVGELKEHYRAPDFDAMVDFAEGMSYCMCETCGNPAETRPGGWVETLCDEHYEEREEKERIAQANIEEKKK